MYFGSVGNFVSMFTTMSKNVLVFKGIALSLVLFAHGEDDVAND